MSQSSAQSPSDDAAGKQPIPPGKRRRLQQCFEHGSKMSAKGDFDYATEMYTQCVVGDPGNVMYVKSFLGNLAKKYNNNKKGSKFASVQGLAIKGSVKKSVLQKDWNGLIPSALEMLKLNPWDAGTLIDLSKACEALQLDEAQVEYLRMALDGDMNDPEVNRAAGRGFGRNGLFDDAINCWSRVLKVKGNDEEANRAIPNLQVERTIHRGGYEEAQTSQDARLNRLKGEDDDEEARLSPEQRLERAIERDPTALEKYLELADLYVRDEKYDLAEKVLTRALEASGGDQQVRERLEDIQIRRTRQQLEIARKRAEAERTKEAIDLYNRFRAELNSRELEVYAHRVERYPANTGFKFELAARLRKAGKVQEAIRLLQECRSDIKRRTQVHMTLGRCFVDIKQFELALTSFEAAVASEGSLATDDKKEALYISGTLGSHLKDFEKARKHFNDLAEIDFGYKDVAIWLDKLRKIREDGGSSAEDS